MIHAAEVLDFLKAMWGLMDGPRAFGLRRDRTLTDFGASKTNKDPHLWVKHKKDGKQPTGKRIALMMSTHLDDIKGAGDDDQREELARLLRRDFGNDLKMSLQNFEFTGIKHAQHVDRSIYCDQDHYIAELSTIPLDHPVSKPDADVPDNLRQSFQSLLGALMWLLQTRADISPYISYLQRVAKEPKYRHVTMINRVLRFTKRVSTGIRY